MKKARLSSPVIGTCVYVLCMHDVFIIVFYAWKFFKRQPHYSEKQKEFEMTPKRIELHLKFNAQAKKIANSKTIPLQKNYAFIHELIYIALYRAFQKIPNENRIRNWNSLVELVQKSGAKVEHTEKNVKFHEKLLSSNRIVSLTVSGFPGKNFQARNDQRHNIANIRFNYLKYDEHGWRW